MAGNNHNNFLQQTVCKFCGELLRTYDGIFACERCVNSFKRSSQDSWQNHCNANFQMEMKIASQHQLNSYNSTIQAEGKDLQNRVDNSILEKTKAVHYTQNIAAVQSQTTSEESILEVARKFEWSHTDFYLPLAASTRAMPIIVLPALSPFEYTESLREAASLHIFANVDWMRTVEVLNTLPSNNQRELAQQSWNILIILALAQFVTPINLGHLLITYHMEKAYGEISHSITHEVIILHDVLIQLHSFKVNYLEYHYLRLLAVLGISSTATNGVNTPDNDTLNARSSTKSHDLTESYKLSFTKAEKILFNYIEKAYPIPTIRYNALLNLLDAMKVISQNTLEELLFRKIIKNTTITNIIGKIFHKLSETKESTKLK